MDKKTTPEQENGDIKYIVLTSPLETISDEVTLELLSVQIEFGQTQNDSLILRIANPHQISQYGTLGLGGNA